MNKKWYQSKTIWMGIATMLGSIITELAHVLSGDVSIEAFVIFVVGAIFAFLRTKTDKAIV